jgi:hypothetical protein
VVFLTRLIRPPAVTVTPVSASNSVFMLLKNEAAFALLRHFLAVLASRAAFSGRH